MATCSMCRIPSKACPVYDDRISICGGCSFKLTILRNGLLECIEVMQDIFLYCPNPRNFHRVFTFIGNHIIMLFEGVAARSKRNNIWQIITHAYLGEGYRFLADAFFEHPEYLQTIKQKVKDDTYLLNILGDESFSFAVADPDGDVSQFIPMETIDSEGSGMWNLGEQLILESLEQTPESDEEDQIF
jgi:hypothetical protein